jgi:hypothetical protein
MRKLFKRSSEKNQKYPNLWPSPSFFFLSFDAMIGPLLFDQGRIYRYSSVHTAVRDEAGAHRPGGGPCPGYLPETKFPNLGTEAHGSELELKFGCYIFYIGNPDT